MEHIINLGNMVNYQKEKSENSKITYAIFALVFILTFSISTALISEKQFTCAEAVHYYTNINYKDLVVFNGELEVDLVNDIVKAIDRIPYKTINKLVVSGWKIRIIDCEASEKLGEAIPKDKVINIYRNGIYLCNTRTVLDTTIHEIGHAIDCVYGLSGTKEFINIFKTQQDNFFETSRPLSEYHKKNRLEMFACAMTEFILHGEELKINNAVVYDYMLRIWEKYCNS